MSWFGHARRSDFFNAIAVINQELFNKKTLRQVLRMLKY